MGEENLLQFAVKDIVRDWIESFHREGLCRELQFLLGGRVSPSLPSGRNLLTGVGEFAGFFVFISHYNGRISRSVRCQQVS